jgi:hypothetical protein
MNCGASKLLVETFAVVVKLNFLSHYFYFFAFFLLFTRSEREMKFLNQFPLLSVPR